MSEGLFYYAFFRGEKMNYMEIMDFYGYDLDKSNEEVKKIYRDGDVIDEILSNANLGRGYVQTVQSEPSAK